MKLRAKPETAGVIRHFPKRIYLENLPLFQGETINMTIPSIIPNPDDLLALEPEELAGVVMEYLNSQTSNSGVLNRYNFSLNHTVKDYPLNYHEATLKALMEAWMWLEKEGFIAPKPGDSGDWIFITRKGKRIQGRTDLESYRKAKLFPKNLLHPVIVQKTYSMFLRGEYDTAVFQSFKEVEVTVRLTGGYAQTDLGVSLMRKAFDKDSGALVNSSIPIAEREAMSNLFAGSIGLYKNPHSHRNEPITKPEEAINLLIWASHLLFIVESNSLKTKCV